jgi:chromosome partitioning protein
MHLSRERSMSANGTCCSRRGGIRDKPNGFERVQHVMGRVICISSQKGGVGKTTITVNLSTALALAERTCLLVDGDPQGHATLGLSAIHRNRKGTLWQAMTGRSSIRDVVVPTSLKFLHLLPANRELLRAEAELPRMRDKESRLRRLLEALKSDYEFILIDTPPALGLLTLNGLVAADSLLIPLQCEFYAYAGLKQYLRFVDVVKEHLNPRLRLEGILLNMLFPERVLSRRIAEEAKACFGRRIIQTAIPWDGTIQESAVEGKPLLLQDMKSASSALYLALAGEIMRRKEGTDSGKQDFAVRSDFSVSTTNWREITRAAA